VSRILWSLQVLLALVFLLAGAMKLLSPLEVLAINFPLPGALTRSIGVAETLGAVGLILPALLRIRPQLTPLAATCLAGLMTGATLLTPTALGFGISDAVLPLVLCLLSAFVAYGRFRLAPIEPAVGRGRLISRMVN
jgi:uncharacterized membrane protein YphA (DoxX/SURF4 family)